MSRMPAIRLLAPDVVTLIAAGEVVEGPESVVKELVENAIDAGSSRIAVTVRSAGGAVRSVRVVDDGIGIDPASAPLAFTRYATSKIADASDLAGCMTMGFRGEALASIGAVSRVTLTTKPAGSGAVAGTRIVHEGGETISVEEAGAPGGTTVLVEDIFYNTPARLKFAKSLQTGIGRITGIMERAALTHPGISFLLAHNGKELLATTGTGDLLTVIAELFGQSFASSLIPVTARYRHGEISGYIGRPDQGRSNPYQVFISVNRRPVISRPLTQAVRAGYGTLLPKDRYPVAFLDLTAGDGVVDVNVHPAKRFVRMRDEEKVCTELTGAVREALEGKNLIPVQGGGIPARQPPAGPVRYSHVPESQAAAVREAVASRRTGADTDRRLRRSESIVPDTLPETGILPRFRVIGQALDLYIVAESGSGGIVLIDQHAAHERILYEQLLASPFGERQELITPVVIDLPPRDRATLMEMLPDLGREGFQIEEFGKGGIIIRSIPVVLGRTVTPETVREVIAEFLSGERQAGGSERERVVRVVACRGAVKAGAACTIDQCERLLAQLRSVKNPFTCPHGRPTMVSFPESRLGKMFGRE